MNREEFGKALNVSPAILYTYEKGGTPPKMSVLKSLADWVGIPVMVLTTIKLTNKFLEEWPHNKEEQSLYIEKHQNNMVNKKSDVHADPQLVMEDSAPYSKDDSLSTKMLYNLTESNKILAESNRTLAQANKQIADNTSAITQKFITGGIDPSIYLDVKSSLQALQEYLTEIAAQVKKTTVAKAGGELGIRMVEKRNALSKKGTLSGGSK